VFGNGERRYEVDYSVTRNGLRADGYEDVSLVSAEPDRVVLDIAGVRRTFAVARYDDVSYVDSSLGAVALAAQPRFADPDSALAAGSLVAPMPGTVVRLAVSEGDSVRAGDPLLWLEAMKMEHKISAPADGVVAALPVEVGQQVEVGAVLAVVGETE
jgi:propionyl-CoA carboxylase alpha chain